MYLHRYEVLMLKRNTLTKVETAKDKRGKEVVVGDVIYPPEAIMYKMVVVEIYYPNLLIVERATCRFPWVAPFIKE